MRNRISKINLIVAALFAGFILLPSVSAQTQGGAVIFEKRCYSCHNIGSGDKKGPDLKGVTTQQSREWLREFIKSPAAMNRKGDQTATALFKKFSPEVMPDQDITDDQLDSIFALIDQLTSKNEIFVPAGAKLSRAIVPEDTQAGYDLFTGKIALASGGTSCISCHNVNGVGRMGGGTLGPDLTAVNAKYKDPELISILQTTTFPTMKSVFAAHPLNDEEIVKIFAFLQNARAANPAVQPGVNVIDPWFIFAGFAATLAAFIGMDRLWRNRLRGVRQQIVRRAER